MMFIDFAATKKIADLNENAMANGLTPWLTSQRRAHRRASNGFRCLSPNGWATQPDASDG